MDVAVVGAGRVGTALAVLLSRAGHRIVAVSGRAATRDRVARYLPGVPVVSPHDAGAAAELVLLGVPDDRLEHAGRGIAGRVRPGATLAHLSGSAPLDVLGADARRLSIHPLQTVPDVDAGIERIPGSHMAVTASDEETSELGEALARDVGATPFRLADDRKPLYHAAAVFSSNYVVVLEAVAERLFSLAGLERPLESFAPLARSTLDNVLERGPMEALTGPAARGDAGTIRRNLEALSAEAPHAVPAYVELARAAAHLAEAAGRLPDGSLKQVEEVLAEWR